MKNRLLSAWQLTAIVAAISPLIISIAQATDVVTLSSPADNYELKYKIQQSLGRASPMTLFGPVVSQDIQLTAAGAGYHVDVIRPQLFGVLPLEQLSFDLTPTDGDLYHISNMTLPGSIELDPGTSLNIGAVNLEGDWSFTDFSYKSLDSTLSNITVEPAAGEALLSLKALDIDVNASDSAELHLQLTELSEQLIGGNKLGSASIRLFANGDQQLDIHQIFSEVLTQGVLNDNLPAAYQLLLSLKDNHYDQVTLEVNATDLELNDGYEDLGLADGVQLSVDLSDVTPERWGEALAILSLDNFRSNSVFDDYSWQQLISSDYDWDADEGAASVSEGLLIEQGSARLHIVEVPVKALVEVFRWINNDSYQERIAASAFYDAFLANDSFDLSLNIGNGKMLTRDSGFSMDQFAINQRLEGFKALDGQKHIVVKWADFAAIPRTETIDKDMAKEIGILMGYIPHDGNIDITVENLHLDLLYRLAKNTSFYKDMPIGLASLAPYLLSLEPVITQHVEIHSDALQLLVDGNAKVALASVFNPVITGKSQIEITGLKTLQNDIDQAMAYGYFSPQDLEVGRAMIGAALGYANSTNGKTHTWEIITEPKLDGADVTINGYPFYSNELMSGYMGIISSSLPYLIMFGGMGMF